MKRPLNILVAFAAVALIALSCSQAPGPETEILPRLYLTTPLGFAYACCPAVGRPVSVPAPIPEVLVV